MNLSKDERGGGAQKTLEFAIREQIDTEDRVGAFATSVGIPIEPEQGDYATGRPDPIWIAEQMAAKIKEAEALRTRLESLAERWDGLEGKFPPLPDQQRCAQELREAMKGGAQ